MHVREHHQHRLATGQLLDLLDQGLDGALFLPLRAEVERPIAIIGGNCQKARK